jgi:hypothetical protein
MDAPPMKKPRRRTCACFLYALLALLLSLAGAAAYTAYDNQRFIVVEHELTLPRLPASFDGFRILLISDMHGSTFGERQERLVNAINRLDYDLIAFAGDMGNSLYGTADPASPQAVLDLLDGLTDKTYVFWVDGNWGPYALDSAAGSFGEIPTSFGAQLQARGVRLLALPFAIPRGADRLWITPRLSEAVFEWDRQTFEALDYPQFEPAHAKAVQAYQALRLSSEVKILLTHFPLPVNLPPAETARWQELDYDLILAGHYHGGQVRLPFIGALYIPTSTTGLGGTGYLPDQDIVKGVSYFEGTPQVVSAGLGASSPVRWLRFRLFNTPEINLITLRSPAAQP